MVSRRWPWVNSWVLHLHCFIWLGTTSITPTLTHIWFPNAKWSARILTELRGMYSLVPTRHDLQSWDSQASCFNLVGFNLSQHILAQGVLILQGMPHYQYTTTHMVLIRQGMLRSQHILTKGVGTLQGPPRSRLRRTNTARTTMLAYISTSYLILIKTLVYTSFNYEPEGASV